MKQGGERGMKRQSIQNQLLPALKRIIRPHMEAEIKHLSLPAEEKLHKESEYWWQKMRWAINQSKGGGGE